MALLGRVDEADCIDDLHSFLRVVPLEEIKAFLRNRIVSLQNNIDDNNESIVEGLEACDEMKRLSLSILPITDILPTDMMIKTISYLTKDHRKYLPTLSKGFNIIMNNPILYRKYQIWITEPNTNTTENSYYFRSSQDVHIYAEHHYGGTIMIESTTSSRKNDKLPHVQVFDSSLPWRSGHDVTINGLHTYSDSFDSSDQSISMTNSHILRVLMEMKQVRRLRLTRYFCETRLSSYPTFSSVYCLDLADIAIENNSDLKTWLNSKTFPVLTVLTISLISSSKAINDALDSLNVRVLTLVSGEFVRNDWCLKMPKSLEFLIVGRQSHDQSNFMDELDLSQCDKLIGMRVNSAIPFESIIWNLSHPLLYINVNIDRPSQHHWIHSLSYKVKQTKYRWYEAYKNKEIHSQFVIGRCFFEENAIKTVPIKCVKSGCFRFDEKKIVKNDMIQKCIRRMSIPFDIIIEYLQSSIYHNSDYILTLQRYIAHISMNYPRASERNGC